ncbi:hypothetical protein PFLUV_G00170950 [Perca fluviatilis]|uniref:Ig-like domain-containing protein n=1 Tax=Perca fluviatilis TaxID=8168 RepID=A0A6A5EQH6_PERFL|nr:hypothetical protein PFLUV_G00170950 [Perca fluviatilis]
MTRCPESSTAPTGGYTKETGYYSSLLKDLPVVTVHPGDNVILPCWAADSFIIAAEWSRPDLEQEYVLFYRDGHLDPTYQHPSFKDRVELVDRHLKDGDVSLILKNVSSIDTGTYECRVEPGGSRRRKRAIIDSEPIRIVRLQVTEPGSDDRNLSPLGLYNGLAAGVLVLVAAAVGGVLMFKRCKKRPGEPAADEGSGDLTTHREFYTGQLTVLPGPGTRSLDGPPPPSPSRPDLSVLGPPPYCGPGTTDPFVPPYRRTRFYIYTDE